MAEQLTVSAEDDGQRLDRWLKKKFPQLPFGQMQKILRTGQVRVDGKRAKGETRLGTGQSVRIPPQLSAEQKEFGAGVSQKDAAFIQSLVIYKDDDVIALNKPSGLAAQGGTKVGRNVDDLLEALAQDGQKPRLVHRLDKDTSGVLLLARNIKTARVLGDMFKGRDIRKYYWAVTAPAPLQNEGKIHSYLAKTDGPDGERMSSVGRDEGKGSLTFYRVMENVGDKVAWVAFWPRTGRTHQIRVHALEIGCPILGDCKYDPSQEFLGQNPDLPKTLHLHARRVILPHPVSGKKLDITAPLDRDMLKTFQYFGFGANDKSDPFEDVEET